MASALVLVAVTLTTLFIGGYVFAAVVSAIFAGVYREWDTMVTRRPLSRSGMILIALVAISGLVFPAFGPVATLSIIGLAALVALAMRGEAAIWRAGGLIFIGLVLLAVLVMRGAGSMGIWAGLFLGTVVWMTDSAAFFTGRQVGGEKLAPGISPSKTWSGALGGLALGSIAGLVVWIVVTDSPWWIGLGFAISISILGQLGDLCESAVKRHFRIKDSGDIIPGHGGLMDRLDSLTLSVLFVTLVGLAHAGVGDVATGLMVW
jgi:phosphatidate cytidylyltransferase